MALLPNGPVQAPPTRLAPGRRAQRRARRRRCWPGTRRSATSPPRSSAPSCSSAAASAIWNGSWYGGHYTLTYSVLFPPLAALLGPRLVGMLAVDRLLLPLRPPRPRPLGRGGALGDPLVRRRRGDAARRRPAHLRARRRLRPRHPARPPAPAAAPARSPSPPRARSRARSRRSSSPASCSPALGDLPPRPLRPRPRRAVWVACHRLRPCPHPQPRLPRSGPVPLRLLLLRRDPALVRRRAVRHPRPRRRGAPAAPGPDRLRRWRRPWSGWSPNPMGGNAVRLGALFGGPVLAAVVLARRPRLSRALTLLARPRPGRQPLLAADRERHPDRPQRRRPLDRAPPTSHPVAAWLRDHGGRGARIEVPPTANHWESAYLAPEFELARGWLRQIDTTRDDIFYDDEGHSRQRCLPGLAARQRDPLRRPARRAARLLLGRRAAPDPAATRPTCSRAGATPTGASTRCATRRRWCSRSAGGGARVLRVGPQRLRPRRDPPGRVPRPRRLHPLLVDRPRQRLPGPPRRVDAGPRQPARASSTSPPTSRSAGPGTRSPAPARPADRRRRTHICVLVACVQSRHAHSVLIAWPHARQRASESGSSSSARIRARNSAPAAP